MAKTKHLGIQIDYSKDELLSDQAKTLLKKKYLTKSESSPQEGFARAAVAYCGGDLKLAQRIYNAVSQKHFMYSSPILSNAPLPGKKPKALPISCFLNYVDDSLEGLDAHTYEVRALSIKGGGVGGHWNHVRSVSDKAPGPIPFIHTVDADMLAYRQGVTRKGSYAAYMDISHPDIVEFIQMRVPTGDPNRKNLNLHHGVNLSDDFMKAVAMDLDWNLVDPNDGTIRETLKARRLWEMILETRYRTGEPYMNFIDTANRALPQQLKDLGLKIYGSNLCNEIHLPTNKDRTAVCCLLSLNLENYDEWDKNLIRDLIRFLDNVLDEFIKNAGDKISRAKYSAMRERSLGLGAMGLHSLFHKNRIPFESKTAKKLNNEIFKYIKDEAVKESQKLAKERGEAPDMKGSGMRNAHLLAVAPNANSSLIVNTSPSIEPFKANAFTSRTRVGSHMIRNKYLEEELEKLGKNTGEVWSSITTNGGSVQHLDFLPQKLKEVFKTAIELDQEKIIELAADRQKYICQGQSLNLFFPAGADRANLHKVHYLTWELGCKGLYYLRTEASNRAENVSQKIENERLQDAASQDECESCQG